MAGWRSMKCGADAGNFDDMSFGLPLISQNSTSQNSSSRASQSQATDRGAVDIAVSAASSPGCMRCEFIPPPLHGPGVLYLRFPLSHTLRKIYSVVENAGWRYEESAGMLVIRVEEDTLTPYLTQLCAALSRPEQHDVRAFFQKENHEIQFQDLFEIDSLSTLTAKTQSSWLLDLLEEQRLTTWFQPILSCKDDSLFAYECLMRGEEDGKIIFPDRILEIARGANLLFQLDRAARLAAIHNAAKFELTTKIFINFTPTSIYDPRNCLQTTLRAVDESHLSREQIVFEVIESEQVRDTNHLREILDFYRERGFEVALDDVGAGYSSLNLISQIKPDYIKLDRELISDVHSDPYKSLIAQKLLEAAHGLGVKAIAEGVETEADYHWLCEHHATYVQGYFFARPASPPPFLDRMTS